MAHKRPKKNTNELLEDLIWQGAVQTYFLKVIAEGIENMANEVVTQVNAKLDTIEQTLRDEVDEIKAAIEAAGAGGATPEETAALEARLDGLNAAVEALVTTPAPPTE